MYGRTVKQRDLVGFQQRATAEPEGLFAPTHYLLLITHYYTLHLEETKLDRRFGKLEKEALSSVRSLD